METMQTNPVDHHHPAPRACGSWVLHTPGSNAQQLGNPPFSLHEEEACARRLEASVRLITDAPHGEPIAPWRNATFKPGHVHLSKYLYGEALCGSVILLNMCLLGYGETELQMLQLLHDSGCADVRELFDDGRLAYLQDATPEPFGGVPLARAGFPNCPTKKALLGMWEMVDQYLVGEDFDGLRGEGEAVMAIVAPRAGGQPDDSPDTRWSLATHTHLAMLADCTRLRPFNWDLARLIFARFSSNLDTALWIEEICAAHRA